MEGKAKAGPSQQTTGGTQYKYVGGRAVILEGGRPLGPGEYVTLAPEEIVGQNQMLVDEGRLIDATGITPPAEGS